MLCNQSQYEDYSQSWCTSFTSIAFFEHQCGGTLLERGFENVIHTICEGANSLDKPYPYLVRCLSELSNTSALKNQRYQNIEHNNQNGFGFYGTGCNDLLPSKECYTINAHAAAFTIAYADKLIASAAHSANLFDSTEIVFKANLATTDEPTTAVLLLDDKQIQLEREFAGAEGATYTSPNISTEGMSDCLPYIFKFGFSDGHEEQYPEEGALLTFGVGTCTKDYAEEQCTSGVCCNTATKTYKTASTVCSASTSACEADAHCTGESSECPTKQPKPQGTACQDEEPCALYQCDGTSTECHRVLKSAGTVCDAAETLCEEDAHCDGTSDVCPPKAIKERGFVCKEATACADYTCDGETSACEPTYKSSSTLCAAAETRCEEDSYCTGVSSECPEKPLKDKGTECEPAEPCATHECDGSTNECQTVYKTTTTVCNASVSACEQDARCTGKSGACPDKKPKAKGTKCQDDEKCASYQCDGETVECHLVYKPNTTVCDAASSGCEESARCTGTSTVCPKKTLKPEGAVCQEPTSCADYWCDGKTVSCNPTYRNSSVLCRNATGECDLDTYCSGESASCPSRKYKPTGTPCAEPDACADYVCVNYNAKCQRQFRPKTHICANATEECESPAYCTGSSTECPPKTIRAKGEVCRDPTPCADFVCDGNTTTCHEVPRETGTKCANATSACEQDAFCTGTSAECPAKKPNPAGTVCGNSTVCADFVCDGESGECRPTYKTSLCAAASGPCEEDAYCTGNNTECPEKTLKASGAECRESEPCADFVCDGNTTVCHTRYKSEATVCADAASECMDYLCTGSSSECPAEPYYKVGGTACSTGRCTGFSGECVDRPVRAVVSFTVRFVTARALVTRVLVDVLNETLDAVVFIEAKTSSVNALAVAVHVETLAKAEEVYQIALTSTEQSVMRNVRELQLREESPGSDPGPSASSSKSAAYRPRLLKLLTGLLFWALIAQ